MLRREIYDYVQLFRAKVVSSVRKSQWINEYDRNNEWIECGKRKEHKAGNVHKIHTNKSDFTFKHPNPKSIKMYLIIDIFCCKISLFNCFYVFFKLASA